MKPFTDLSWRLDATTSTSEKVDLAPGVPVPAKLVGMTGRQFYDWQTAGGADDVMRMVDALERAELRWCSIGGIAVN